ncbi:MAG: hypothetical protein IJG60_04240 [Thermoguttaceae bacterium]|nr:hypothetical protein [Thermoguttaceae bacterium]
MAPVPLPFLFRAALTAAVLFSIPFAAGTGAEPDPAASFHLDTAQAGTKPIGNKLSSVNVWKFESLSPPTEQDRADGADLTPFVEYVQLMQATGSSPDRDLFRDPLNREIPDDYRFEPLLDACALILSLGARPHIKFSVPFKYSANPENGDFQTNVFPPDDYGVYDTFVAALARALTGRFGLAEVRRWRFGVLTEFENPGWFRARSGTPDDSREAYFELYDHTAETLSAELGPGICIGAHAMSCSEGLWDERDFLNHCATGVNFKTGKTGSPISFIAVSFYDYAPGKPAAAPLPEVVGRLRARAEEVGLTNLFYGVDEGRILYGLHSGTASADLFQRAVGRTYQAAFDARLLKQMVDADIDYFSSWSYSTGGVYHGLPTPGYFVARLFSEFRGAYPLRIERTEEAGLPDGVEIDAVAGWEPAAKTLRLMVWHFKDDYGYIGRAKAALNITAPDLAGKRARVTKWTVDDRVNFFPEWEKDRERYNIGNDCFFWSPDDPGLDDPHYTLTDPDARKIYETVLRPRYAQIAKLDSEEEIFEIPDSGELVLETQLDHHAVVFYRIEPVE